MLRTAFIIVLATLFLGCTKEPGTRVAIYELKSFSKQTTVGTNPASIVITDAILADEPFVSDEDILFYTRSTTTFTLNKDINPIIRNYNGDKGFAVTVDGAPVYYGVFHPLILSSLTIGVATIDPLLSRKELPIYFVLINGNDQLRLADKRNDSRILAAMQASGRLR